MLSFVHRQRALSAKRQQAYDQLWPSYGLALEQGIIDFSRIFGNSNPVNLEIGFGMSEGFFANVHGHPEQNFIGIEVHRPGIGALLLKLFEERLPNLRIFADNAVEVMARCIPDQSLQRILIFFPDPWPKRRHHKRRLIQLDFTAMLRQKLVPEGGYVHLATDDADYAAHITRVIDQVGGFSSCPKAHAWPRPSSKFALRSHRSFPQKQIWDLIFSKK